MSNENVQQQQPAIPVSLQRRDDDAPVPPHVARAVANLTNELAAGAGQNTGAPATQIRNGTLELPAAESITINLEREKITSMCANNTTMTGSIITTGGYRLDGVLDGDLDAATTVVISEGARLTGNLKAEKAVVLGQVDGALEIRGTLILARTALVKGDITYGTIVNYQGAQIEGKIKRISR